MEYVRNRNRNRNRISMEYVAPQNTFLALWSRRLGTRRLGTRRIDPVGLESVGSFRGQKKLTTGAASGEGGGSSTKLVIV